MYLKFGDVCETYILDDGHPRGSCHLRHGPFRRWNAGQLTVNVNNGTSCFTATTHPGGLDSPEELGAVFSLREDCMCWA